MQREDFWHDGKIAALAAGKQAAVTAQGGRKASATLTWTVNPTAGETVTINGVVFAAVAANPTGNQFLIAGTLTQTLDNLAAKITAAALRISAVKTSGTVITLSSFDYDVAGNAITVAASVATRSAATLTGGANKDVLDLGVGTVGIVTVAGSAPCELDLPDGDEGQEITLYLKTKGAGANAIVNGTFNAGATSATFDAAGDFVKLKWLGGKWVALTNSSVTIS